MPLLQAMALLTSTLSPAMCTGWLSPQFQRYSSWNWRKPMSLLISALIRAWLFQPITHCSDHELPLFLRLLGCYKLIIIYIVFIYVCNIIFILYGLIYFYYIYQIIHLLLLTLLRHHHRYRYQNRLHLCCGERSGLIGPAAQRSYYHNRNWSQLECFFLESFFCFYILWIWFTSFDEYFGNSILKKHVSALGSALSG